MDRPDLVDPDDSRQAVSGLNRADERAPGPIGRIVLQTGLEGRGPVRSAERVADAALRGSEDPEAAIERLVREHVAMGAAGGLATGGAGHLAPLPVALAVSLAEFYVVATRMVGAIAILRGYDVRQRAVRSAVLLTLVAARSDEVLTREGIRAGMLPQIALRRLPPGALMLVNKAVFLRVLRRVSERYPSRLGRGAPVLAGGIGAALDSWMMSRIAGQALVEFPPVTSAGMPGPSDGPP